MNGAAAVGQHPGVLRVRLFGDLWFKIKNCHNVRMCMHEFFNPILQIEWSVHEYAPKAMMKGLS